MSLDPKKLDDLRIAEREDELGIDGYYRCGFNKCLDHDFVRGLEARAARADELERELAKWKEGHDVLRRSLEAERRRFGEIRSLLTEADAEIAALKAELARFEWRDIGELTDSKHLVVGKTYDESLIVGYRYDRLPDAVIDRQIGKWKRCTEFLPIQLPSDNDWRNTRGILKEYAAPTPPQAKEADLTIAGMKVEIDPSIPDGEMHIKCSGKTYIVEADHEA